MATTEALPLPLARDRSTWGYVERDALGADGACDLVFRTPAEPDAGPVLPPALARALPLLLHELDRQPGLGAALAELGVRAGEVAARDRDGRAERHRASPGATLRRLLPRVVTYRFVESKGVREFVFDGYRPSSIHVLGRVLASEFRFRLEDLTHFATHGELLLGVLEVAGLERALDPEAILYCPALDSPFPFKFAVVGRAERDNRETYLDLLRQLLRRTESDEAFRARNFRELARGFQKFGPAAATPEFQEVELATWRLLSYLAARLRVKAGRLTDALEPRDIAAFLGELRHVHQALDDLVHLPGRLAAFYRSRFDLEFSGLHERALPELQEIARRIDCDLEDRDRSIDAVATLVSEFRRLGSASPLESLEEKDREIKAAYGDVEVPPIETGWVRSYTETIFTGAKRFDTRRFDSSVAASEGDEMSELDLELDMDVSFGFGGGDEEADGECDDAAAGGGWGGEDDAEGGGFGLDVDLSFLDDDEDQDPEGEPH